MANAGRRSSSRGRQGLRAELVEKGILSAPKPPDPNFISEVLGVARDKTSGKCRVRVGPKGGKKVIQGGCFTEKAGAEAKALQLREKDGQRQLNPVATMSGVQGEAQGPLGGGAGALVPSRCGMEEEAGKGEGGAREGCKAQGKAWAEAAKLTAKSMDPECTARVARMAHLQHPNLQT